MSSARLPVVIAVLSLTGLFAGALSACGGGGAPAHDPVAAPSGTPGAAPTGSPSAAKEGAATDAASAYSSDKRKYVCGCLGTRLGVSEADCTDKVASDPDAYVPECFRAAPNDCDAYIECVYMEPSGTAKCLPSEEYTVTGTCAGCRCAVPCGDGKPACPAGKACEEDPSGKKVCM